MAQTAERRAARKRATPAATQALVRALRFVNTTQNPGAATRVARLTVTDDVGHTSAAQYLPVHVVTVDIPPTLPDLTLLLDLAAAEGRSRASLRKGPADRMEQEEGEFYEAVRRGYLELADAHPERFRVIDASPSEQAVEVAIEAAIMNRLKEVV